MYSICRLVLLTPQSSSGGRHRHPNTFEVRGPECLTVAPVDLLLVAVGDVDVALLQHLLPDPILVLRHVLVMLVDHVGDGVDLAGAGGKARASS